MRWNYASSSISRMNFIYNWCLTCSETIKFWHLIIHLWYLNYKLIWRHHCVFQGPTSWLFILIFSSTSEADNGSLNWWQFITQRIRVIIRRKKSLLAVSRLLCYQLSDKEGSKEIMPLKIHWECLPAWLMQRSATIRKQPARQLFMKQILSTQDKVIGLCWIFVNCSILKGTLVG